MSEERIKVLTPEFRMSFPSLFQPSKFSVEDGNPKYELTMLFEDGSQLTELKEAVKKAASQEWPKKLPTKLVSPIKSGDEERPDDALYEGISFAKARSKYKPIVVNANKEPISETEAEEIYGGCYGRALVSVFAYDYAGNKGVALSLEAVQKIRDGEKIGASPLNVDDIFGESPKTTDSKTDDLFD